MGIFIKEASQILSYNLQILISNYYCIAKRNINKLKNYTVFVLLFGKAPTIGAHRGICASSIQLPLAQQLRSHYLSCMLCSSSRLNISILQLSLRFCKERESKKECAISLLSPKPGNVSLLELQDHNTILHYVSIYCTRATLLQILLGRGSHIDFSLQLKFG